MEVTDDTTKHVDYTYMPPKSLYEEEVDEMGSSKDAAMNAIKALFTIARELKLDASRLEEDLVEAHRQTVMKQQGRYDTAAYLQEIQVLSNAAVIIAAMSGVDSTAAGALGQMGSNVGSMVTKHYEGTIQTTGNYEIESWKAVKTRVEQEAEAHKQLSRQLGREGMDLLSKVIQAMLPLMRQIG